MTSWQWMLFEQIIQQRSIVIGSVGLRAEIEAEILRARDKDAETLPEEFGSILFPQTWIALDPRNGLPAIGRDKAEIAPLDRSQRVLSRMRKFRIKQIDSSERVLAIGMRNQRPSDKEQDARRQESIHRRGQDTILSSFRPAVVARIEKRRALNAARLSRVPALTLAAYFS